MITIFYREGQSTEQVASLLGMREAAVRKRLSQAREVLREEMLARLGGVLAKSTPSVIFTDRVMAAIPSGLPAASTATGAKVAASTVAKGAGAGAIWGAAGPMLAQILVQFLWFKREAARAVDPEGRAQLRKFAIAQVMGMNLWVAVAFVCITRGASHLPMMLGGGAWVTFAIWSREVWYERIVGRRRAAEVERDPDAASRQHRNKVLRRTWYAIVIAGTTALTLLA